MRYLNEFINKSQFKKIIIFQNQGGTFNLKYLNTGIISIL